MTVTDRLGDNDPASPEDGVLRADFDWSETTPSSAVIEMIAVATDREPTAMEPLYETVDPDALDTLVSSNGNAHPRDGVAVSLTLAGHDVIVNGDGAVVVRPVASRSESA